MDNIKNRIKEFINNEIEQYGDKAMGKDTVQSRARIETYEKVLNKIEELENEE